MVKVKLCGFKELEDINFAFSAGVDFIGLNNIVISKRFLNADEIIYLLEKLNPEYYSKIVILLNHLDLPFLRKLKKLGLVHIQSYLLAKEDQVLFDLGFEVIKVFAISDSKDLELVKNFNFTNYSYCLLDTKHEGSLGGTGKIFNWKLFCELDLFLKIDLILAGGLNPGNIVKALADTHASFIDLASGVEEKTGEKSYASIKELLGLVKG